MYGSGKIFRTKTNSAVKIWELILSPKLLKKILSPSNANFTQKIQQSKNLRSIPLSQTPHENFLSATKKKILSKEFGFQLLKIIQKMLAKCLKISRPQFKL